MDPRSGLDAKHGTDVRYGTDARHSSADVRHATDARHGSADVRHGTDARHGSADVRHGTDARHAVDPRESADPRLGADVRHSAEPRYGTAPRDHVIDMPGSAVPSSSYSRKHEQAAAKIQALQRGAATRGKVPRKSNETLFHPAEAGFGHYTEVHMEIPRVNDQKRFEVRDHTAAQVLTQLGLASSHRYSYATGALAVLGQIYSRPSDMSDAVRLQVQKVRLFQDGEVDVDHRQRGGLAEVSDAPDNYLLGQFACLAIPVQADYDSNFERVPCVSDSRKSDRRLGHQLEPAPSSDCDGPAGFEGWFWVMHAAAPNIGESSHAEDFIAYSKADPNSPATSSQRSIGYRPSSRGPARRLETKWYVADMRRLWRLALASMGELRIEDGIFFPFGMGAFLRFLWQNDDSFTDPAVMRDLRLQVARELMIAIAELCVDGVDRSGSGVKRGPSRVHLCLVGSNEESIVNHNCFVEAAMETLRVCPGLRNVLQLRRNVDAFQLAHELASSFPGRTLKVCMLNGANRKLMGNHWFQQGARNAIDENIHRRSASLARVGLLLNRHVEPQPRTPTELADNLHALQAGLPQTGDALGGQTFVPGSVPDEWSAAHGMPGANTSPATHMAAHHDTSGSPGHKTAEQDKSSVSKKERQGGCCPCRAKSKVTEVTPVEVRVTPAAGRTGSKSPRGDAGHGMKTHNASKDTAPKDTAPKAPTAVDGETRVEKAKGKAATGSGGFGCCGRRRPAKDGGTTKERGKSNIPPQSTHGPSDHASSSTSAGSSHASGPSASRSPVVGTTTTAPVRGAQPAPGGAPQLGSPTSGAPSRVDAPLAGPTGSSPTAARWR